MLKKKSLCPRLFLLLALSPLSSIYAGKYNASIILEGSAEISISGIPTREIPLPTIHQLRCDNLLGRFHKPIQDAMREGLAPRFTDHPNFRTPQDQENLAIWKDEENRFFNPAGKPSGAIDDNESLIARTLRPLDFYKEKAYGGDPIEYFYRMPYGSLSLVRPSNAEFFNTSERSTGLFFNIHSENILAVASGCLGSGYAHDYLKNYDYALNFQKALLSGVSSPENCMSASGTARCGCPISNEIVIQPSIPNGPSCSITGAFVLENSPDFSDWKLQSQEFYNWSKDRGLAVIRFWETVTVNTLKELNLEDLFQKQLSGDNVSSWSSDLKTRLGKITITDWLKKQFSTVSIDKVKSFQFLEKQYPGLLGESLQQIVTSDWLNEQLSDLYGNKPKLFTVLWESYPNVFNEAFNAIKDHEWLKNRFAYVYDSFNEAFNAIKDHEWLKNRFAYVYDSEKEFLSLLGKTRSPAFGQALEDLETSNDYLRKSVQEYREGLGLQHPSKKSPIKRLFGLSAKRT